MNKNQIQNYIVNLPIGPNPVSLGLETEEVPGAVDTDQLPAGIIAGSNLVQFDGEIDPILRSSVALSLLAAQRVAKHDTVVADPDQWIERHNTVLKNLNWLIQDSGSVQEQFDKVDITVHDAIIPFLTAALGGPIAASSLIIKALEQLQQVNKDSPWITLFDQESRRFDVSEYHFTRVAVDRDHLAMNLVAARFGASYGRTQVLFFRITKQHATFNLSHMKVSAESELLRITNDALKAKLALLTNDYIRKLDL